MTKKTNKGKKPLQKMSVSQFKVWIQGLTAFQDDNWVPNVHQWNLVKEMIENLNDTTVVHQGAVQHSPAVNRSMDTDVVLPYQNQVVAEDNRQYDGGATVAVQSQPVQRFPLSQQFIGNSGKPAELDESGKPIGESNPRPAFI